VLIACVHPVMLHDVANVGSDLHSSSFGSAVEIDGTYEITSNTAMFTQMNGQTPATTSMTGCLSVLAATKRSSPKGGVIMPMQMLRVTTMPKCTGSMPSAVVTLNICIGMKISMIEFASMNMPAMRKRTL